MLVMSLVSWLPPAPDLNRRACAEVSALPFPVKSGLESIRKQCGPAIAAVRDAGGRLLYRGTPPDSVLLPQRMNEAPDLLDPATYGERGALYFQRLERHIEHLDGDGLGKARPRVRPSNGHIAVADSKEAAAWGDSCSCWPIGDFDYLFFTSSRLIYPLPDTHGQPETAVFQRDLSINDILSFGELCPRKCKSGSTVANWSGVTNNGTSPGSRAIG